MVLFSIALEGDKPLEAYSRYAHLMEKYGFYSMQIYEHIPYKPAWPIVFHVAKYTRSLKIGPVTVPVYLYEPITLARYLAVLDELTRGRAIIGFSRGAYYELAGHGRSRSIKSVKELVEAVSSLLNSGMGGYKGQTFTIRDELRLWWQGKLDVEMYIGTSGPKMACIAASIPSIRGIVVDNLWNPSYVKLMLDNIKRCAVNAGRMPEELQLIARPFCFVANDEEEARRCITPYLRQYLPDLIGNSPMLNAAGFSYKDLLDFREEEKVEDLQRIIQNFSATGDADAIIEQTSRIIDAGARHICYGHPLGRNIEEAIKIIGEKIKPYFQQYP